MTPAEQPRACPQCGTLWGVALLACPQCGRLVYAAELKDLAAQAAAAESAANMTGAVAAWRTALRLLPEGAGQRQKIEAEVERLERRQASGASDQEAIRKKSRGWAKWLGAAAPAAAFLATKGKFLILGLTKLPTLASMLLFLSVYWETWGWAFALGFVLSIYIHEMGHAIVLRHYGIPASAPLFIPGFGAIIFARQRIISAVQDARVGLAGPTAGLLAALVCLGLYAVTGNKLFLALTAFGALINLFNLIPILFLDGARGCRGLDDTQRWIITGIAAACSVVFGSRVSLGIAIVMAGRQLFWKKHDGESSQADTASFALFAILLVTLAGLTAIEAPTPEQLRGPGARG